jgi:dTDP-4-amino-4,6-dideoxygalactose transaminase
MIPFNKPFLIGKELSYIQEAVQSGKISGDGPFSRKCHRFFETNLGFNKVLLTTSCTDALEMSAILCDIKPGDEVIMPAFTFVSTANAFVLRGASIVFADCYPDHPNLDHTALEGLITERTRAIVPVHYAGVACDMDPILQMAARRQICVVEDAAQSMDSRYKGRLLGSIGHFGAFSFHETKNIISGEGGLLAINDTAFIRRAEIIWEKGTNRSAFFRGETNKYEWIDVGSSFLPSEITAAFLLAQLECLEEIQTFRKKVWQNYWSGLAHLADSGAFKLPVIPDYATNNAGMFYLVCTGKAIRDQLIEYLKQSGIYAMFHYLPLHLSPYFRQQGKTTAVLPNTEQFSDCLIRLPFYYGLTEEEQQFVIEKISDFYHR